jgi:hypothetical protein
MKIYLDDIRGAPDSTWTVVRTTKEALKLLLTEDVEAISLDNDLGADSPEGRELLDVMILFNIWPSKDVFVHTANIVVGPIMEQKVMKNFYLPKIYATHKDDIFNPPR